MTYQFISDSGHGWLKVRHSELKELGIQDKISSYSYSNGVWAYLEEDCDVDVLINAIGGIDKLDIRVDYIDGHCYVREYNRYPASAHFSSTIER